MQYFIKLPASSTRTHASLLARSAFLTFVLIKAMQRMILFFHPQLHLSVYLILSISQSHLCLFPFVICNFSAFFVIFPLDFILFSSFRYILPTNATSMVCNDVVFLLASRVYATNEPELTFTFSFISFNWREKHLLVVEHL